MSEPGTGPARARLAAELQALRERLGLSLVALAERTPYSKSTWGRYLNGATLPPWSAVQALTKLADEPEARLRALWELAEHEWSGRDVVGPARGTRSGPPKKEPNPEPAAEAEPESKTIPTSVPAPASASAPTPRSAPHSAARRPRTVLLAALAAFALLCCAFAVGTVVAGHHSAAATGGTVWGPIGCVGQACDGRDPGDANCGVDPDSLGEFKTAGGADLEIRYKAPCQAAWARVWQSAVGDRLSITSTQGKTMSAVVGDKYTAQTYFYTPMIPAAAHGLQLRACLTPPHGRAECLSAAVP